MDAYHHVLTRGSAVKGKPRATLWLQSQFPSTQFGSMQSQSDKGDVQETANEQNFWITIYPPLGTAVS